LDSNGLSELFSISKNDIKLFNLVKGEKINAIFDENTKVFDENGKGNLRLLTNPMQTVIKDASGKELKRARKPSIQSGYFIEKNGNISTLYFGQNHFGLFDLDGKLKAKYIAPLSEERYGYFDKRDELLDGDLKVSIFGAEAVRVKLFKDKPEFLVVTAQQASKMYNFNVMLYIYDSKGELVYQELFDETGMVMCVMPPTETDNEESLLIVGNKKVWKYTAE
jgi:hypothetical protein